MTMQFGDPWGASIVAETMEEAIDKAREQAYRRGCWQGANFAGVLFPMRSMEWEQVMRISEFLYAHSRDPDPGIGWLDHMHKLFSKEKKT